MTASGRNFIGSEVNRSKRAAQWGVREAVTPDTREALNEILEALRNDREKGWQMLPDGRYALEEGGEGTSSQEALYRYFSKRRVSLQESSAPAGSGKKTKDATESRGGFFGWLRRLRG